MVLTGAGISTDSGLRDFRGPQGLWTKDPAAEKASNISHYLADPAVRERAWRRRADASPAAIEPNAGHRALVDLERSGRLHTLITQNVDGFTRRPAPMRRSWWRCTARGGRSCASIAVIGRRSRSRSSECAPARPIPPAGGVAAS